MNKRELLYRVVWRCDVCWGEQTRSYDKKPFPSNYFEGGTTVYRAMICKGPCRRPPASVVEEAAVADHKKSIPVQGYIGPADGMMPATTMHLMLSVNHNRAEKRRREVMR